MSHADLLNMNLKDFCDLFQNGNLPEQFSHMSLTEIVSAVTNQSDAEKSTDEEEPQPSQSGPQQERNVLCDQQVRAEHQDDELEVSAGPHPHQPHGVAGSPAQEQVGQQEGDVQVIEKQKKTVQVYQNLLMWSILTHLKIPQPYNHVLRILRRRVNR